MKYCSAKHWLRWYQTFSKKIILKGTCPSLKLRNVWCDFSVLERAHGLKFRGKAPFLMPNTMTEKFFQYSEILVNLGIKFESHLYPVEIFCSPNMVSDSVENFESYDIKFITWFPGNPILKILIKICNCVGYTNMRRQFLVKVSLIALFNCPVILRHFLVWVYLILSEPTQFQPT